MEKITKQMIEDVVTITLAKLGKDGFPFCVAEAARINQIDTDQKKTGKIVTGNGNPEDGLIYQFAQSEIHRKADHETLKEIRAGIWSVVLIGIGLIVTNVFQLIFGK
jgi:hypothetical protein